ncbi:MAG: penicillin acylase family protein, partial [Oxalobacteraceae bacterium]
MVLRTLPAAVLATLALSLVPALPAEARQAMEMETHRVAGLSRPAEILVDRWGVPHIYARSQDDAIFAQGFNAARDRLFQIDLWRRRGLGQLAEVMGPAYVAQDEATRLFLYRGDMQREWKSYGNNAEPMARAFTAGINAYVDFLQAHPERMPFEFKTLGYAPAKWQPEDVVRIRSHGLTRNLNSEVARAAVACKADLKSDEVRFGLTPPWQAAMPDGLDPCLPKDLLAV